MRASPSRKTVVDSFRKTIINSAKEKVYFIDHNKLEHKIREIKRSITIRGPKQWHKYAEKRVVQILQSKKRS